MSLRAMTGGLSAGLPWRQDVSGIGAIGPSASASAIPGQSTGGGRTALDSEIASCQRQLADLVTCPSSTTPQGKAAMQALSDRIAAARAAINNTPSRSSALATIQPMQVAQVSQASQSPGRVDVWA